MFVMVLRSIHDIPDEIKNIIELFYLRGEEVARDEMKKLRATRPDLNSLIDEVSQLIPTAPESVFMFYDALIASDTLAANIDSDLRFEVSNLMGDPSDSAESDLRFSVSGNGKVSRSGSGESGQSSESRERAERRTEKKPDYDPLFFDFSDMPDVEMPEKAGGTGVSSSRAGDDPAHRGGNLSEVKSDGGGYGLRGGGFSPNSEYSADIPLDIDFDFLKEGASDPLESEAPSGREALGAPIRLSSSEALLERASNDYVTPVPNNIQAAQMDKLQEKTRANSASVPSIMRAAQMSQAHEEQIQARRIAELLQNDYDADVQVHSSSPAPDTMRRSGEYRRVSSLQKNLVKSEFGEVSRGGSWRDSDSNPRRRLTSSPFSASGKGLGHGRESRTSTLYMSSAAFEDDDDFMRPTQVAMHSIAQPEHLDQGGRGLAALNRIQPIYRIPRLLCKMSELSQKKGINPRAGFILSMIDGNTTIADILDISSWSEGETAILLLELEEMGIISFS